MTTLSGILTAPRRAIECTLNSICYKANGEEISGSTMVKTEKIAKWSLVALAAAFVIGGIALTFVFAPVGLAITVISAIALGVFLGDASTKTSNKPLAVRYEGKIAYEPLPAEKKAD